MAFVWQRNKSDCGIAVLAMLCDVTYEAAGVSIEWNHSRYKGTTTKQLREAALNLGYLTRSTPQHRLKKVSLKEWDIEWGKLPPPGISDYWYSIPNNSLVKMKRARGGGWHWVAWRKQKIHDPDHGVFHPSQYGYKPVSYMEFIKCE